MARSVNSFVVIVFAAGLCVVPATAARAAAAPDLYVDRQGTGVDCTAADPCPAIQTAVDLAGTAPTTVHVADGVYTGRAVTIASGQVVALVGSHGVQIRGDVDGPAVTNAGTLTLQDVVIQPQDRVGVQQDGGLLTMRRVQIRSGTETALAVAGGETDVQSSELSPEAASGPDSVRLSSGRLSMLKTVTKNAVVETGGTLTLDRHASAAPIQVSGGRAAVTDTTFRAAGAVRVSGTGRAQLSNDIFDGGSMTVDGADAGAVVTRTTGYGNGPVFLVTNAATVEIAATVIDGDQGALPVCVGTVVDGGYNSVRDESCHLTASTSTNSQNGVLQANAAKGRFQYDVAPRFTRRIVDAVPVDATAFTPAVPLCSAGSTDLRGQARPVARGCDIGAIELSAVDVDFDTNSDALVWRQLAVVQATVDLAPGSAEWPLAGSVQFDFDDVTACTTAIKGRSTVCRYHPRPGTEGVSVTFTPVGPFRAAAVAGNLTVSRAPLRLGIRATENVRRGHKATVRLHVVNAVTSAPIRAHRATLYFHTRGRGWWRVTSRTTDSHGRAAYTFTPGRNVAYRWRMESDSYYRGGVSATAHTTVR